MKTPRAKGTCKKPVHGLSSRWFAVKGPVHDGELVGIDAVGETLESYTTKFGITIQELCGEGWHEREDLSVCLGVQAVDLLQDRQTPAREFCRVA